MKPAAELTAHDLRLAYGARVVADDLTLAVPPGRITSVVGPNGCGKSTLLRALSRVMRPQEGAVLLDGEDVHTMAPKQVARRVGLLPQSATVPGGITVAELVALGRNPHQGAFRSWTRADDDAVTAALDATDTAALARRPAEELSGGQRQRAWIAMVLAQETDVLLLDEPTSFLDLSHAVDLLDLVRRLNEERGTTVVMVLHDLNLAARYSDHLVAMRDGAIVAEGAPSEVMTAPVVQQVLGLPVTVLTDPVSGAPLVVPGRQSSA